MISLNARALGSTDTDQTIPHPVANGSKHP